MVNPRVLARLCCWTLGLLLLSGCSLTKAPKVPEHKELTDDSLEWSLIDGDVAGKNVIQQALQYYRALDDRPGQWEANLALARWHLARGDIAAASEFGRSALAIGKQLPNSKYRCSAALFVGQLQGDVELYHYALKNAESPLHKALALSLLDQYEASAKQFGRINDLRYADEKGFLLYRYGKAKSSTKHLEQALELYQYAGNALGVVDSLYLLAQLSPSPAAAKGYGVRALHSAKAQQDQRRVKAIQSWLETRME